MKINFQWILVFMTIALHQSQSSAVNTKHRSRRSIASPALAIAVLEDLTKNLREMQSYYNEAKHKRQLDAGYNNRFGAASGAGAALIGLKHASNWKNPGRKRR
ncbi:unnamed protein product [Owenia fusiformis]|uniref:Uncharacterized protein n=1 Tax=Owenia fusiformis TaxID=6347 RepID=A0A8J1Y1Y4_OWEFU|nr:unnamed protein product [Owenia fusiformis]